MRLLILGAGGQIGSELREATLRRGIPAILLSKGQLDICDRSAVQAAIDIFRPTVLINAAAYTNVDGAEREPQAAFRSNFNGPLTLATVSAKAKLPLIHLSTDFVFDGFKTVSYAEFDVPSPLNVYGCSKEAGERAVRDRHDHHVIIRTAWIYGTRGNNFLKDMLRLAGTLESWAVVDDQRGTPTGAEDVADAILKVSVRVSDNSPCWGTYHFAGPEAATRYDFARHIVWEQAKLTGKLPKLSAISSCEFGAAAQRPVNSCLDSELFTKTFDLTARPYSQVIGKVVALLLSKRSGNALIAART